MSTSGERPTVFISYTSADRGWAERVCDALESRGIGCWIAPRDVPFGVEYGDAIIDGIEASPAFALILSAKANGSPHVRRELERAAFSGRRLFPCRVEEVTPTGAVAYAIGNTQRFDLHVGEPDDRLRELAARIAGALAAEPAGRTAGRTAGKGRRRSAVPWLFALLAVGVAVAVAYFLLSSGGRGNGDPPPTAVDPAERRAEEVRARIQENADRLKSAYAEAIRVKTTFERFAVRSVRPSADGSGVTVLLELRYLALQRETATEVTLVVGDKRVERLTLVGDTGGPKSKSDGLRDQLRAEWSRILFP